jgi:trimeric autotransporter adhesin
MAAEAKAAEHAAALKQAALKESLQAVDAQSRAALAQSVSLANANASTSSSTADVSKSMARRAGAGKRSDLSFSISGAHKRARLGDDSLVSAASASISARPPWWHIVDGPEPWDAAATGSSGGAALAGAGSSAAAGSSSLVQFRLQWHSGVLTQPAQQRAATAVETAQAAADTSAVVESAAPVSTQAGPLAAVRTSAGSGEQSASRSAQPVAAVQQQQQQQREQVQEPVHGDAPAEPVHAGPDSGGSAVSGESLPSFGASPATAVLTSQSAARTRALQEQVQALSARIAVLSQRLATAPAPVRAPAAVAATPAATAAVTAAQEAVRTRRRSSAAAAAASVAAAVAATVADASAGAERVHVTRAPVVQLSAAASPPQARAAPTAAVAVSPPQAQRVRRTSAEDSSASSGVLHELPVLSLTGVGAAATAVPASSADSSRRGSAGAGDAAPCGLASLQSRAQAGSEHTRRAAAAERARSIRHSASSPVPQQLSDEPVAFNLAAFTPAAATAATATAAGAGDPYAAAQQDMQRFTAETLAAVQLQRDITSASTDTAESASPSQQQQQQLQQSPPAAGRSARSSSRGLSTPVVAVPGLSDAVSGSGSARLQQPRPAGRARPWSSVSPARGKTLYTCLCSAVAL